MTALTRHKVIERHPAAGLASAAQSRPGNGEHPRRMRERSVQETPVVPTSSPMKEHKMTMHFRSGAEVLTQEGTKLGTVERLVMDPSQDVVTHLVVSKGFLFPKEHVLRVALVTEASHDTVVVGPDLDPHQLPDPTSAGCLRCGW